MMLAGDDTVTDTGRRRVELEGVENAEPLECTRRQAAPMSRSRSVALFDSAISFFLCFFLLVLVAMVVFVALIVLTNLQ